MKSALVILLILSVNMMAQDENTEPVTVNHVDLKRYIGLWYEIAKIPNRFQKNCTGNTTANYSPK